ncbi:hypothetical protein EVAR_59890_1 [Eumeta japonica]|uniref:Uncharacterized protein n=1 Tax=Eumeta variegata TaxID=151549 RepID=A0A4C2AHE6_EUMVA|nr:hypothetical protein EVAR_59890_1 [Eumeta japonica]
MPCDYDASARLVSVHRSPEDWAFFENVQYILTLSGRIAQYGESFSLNLFRAAFLASSSARCCPWFPRAPAPRIGALPAFRNDIPDVLARCTGQRGCGGTSLPGIPCRRGFEPNVEFPDSISSRHLSGAAPTLPRSYSLSVYMCGPTMARRSTVDGSRSQRSEPEFGSVRDAAFRGSPRASELLVSTDVPDSLLRFTPRVWLLPSPVCLGEQTPEDQRGMEGDLFVSSACFQCYTAL